jgi:hypothetical protein
VVGDGEALLLASDVHLQGTELIYGVKQFNASLIYFLDMRGGV